MQSSVSTGTTDPVVGNMDETKSKNLTCKRKLAMGVDIHAGNANCNSFALFFSESLEIPFSNSKVASLELSKEA